MNSPIKIFISYSHKDEEMITSLLKIINPLVENKLVEIWYDRMINAGAKWNDEIESRIKTSELFIYGISSDFCFSESCKGELIKGLKLRNDRKSEVLPVILRNCGWKEIKAISELQASPKDGVAISSFKSVDDGYMDVYDTLKSMIDLINRRKNLSFTEEFRNSLEDIGSLASIDFSGKNSTHLSDLFVYPDLMDQSSVAAARTACSAKELLDRIDKHRKIVISGDAQSGKTSICYKLMSDLLEDGYFPVLFRGKTACDGNLSKRLDTFIKQQYDDPSCIAEEFILPVVDDFFKVSNQDSVLDFLSKFKYSILVVDDVYNLDLKNGSRIREYAIFRIEPYSASKRGDLISRWIKVHSDEDISTGNSYFEHYDKLTRDVDQTLGKVLGRGIVPSYPFFILSILATVDAVGRPLDAEITSQGYCYQVLITIALNKAGVKVSMIDTYVNFLTSLAYHHFRNGSDFTDEQLEEFFSDYKQKFVLASADSDILKRLQCAGIYEKNLAGFYSFAQRYLMYYFAAKYITENIEECKEDRAKIIRNIGVSANAYIAVFIAHHAKNPSYLDELIDCLKDQFRGVEPCFLKKEDTDQIDKESANIIKAMLPGSYSTPSLVRQNQLQEQNRRESETKEDYTSEDRSVRELINAIRMTEVIGQIVKCRAGSLTIVDIDKLITEIILAHGRILSQFISTFKGESAQSEIIDWISSKLKKEKICDSMTLRLTASKIFWNLNYFTILGIVYRCVQTVGSDKLLEEIQKICYSHKTPLTTIIPIGVKMWFKKRLDLKEIESYYSDSDGLLRWILQHFVARYCATHKIEYRHKQQISAALNIKLPVTTVSDDFGCHN